MTTLNKLITRFASKHRRLADGDFAAGLCGEASEAFSQMLRKAKFPNTVFRIAECDGTHKFSRYYPKSWFYHYVVLVGLNQDRFSADDRDYWDNPKALVPGVIVDWTARQYNKRAPFPLLYKFPIPLKRIEGIAEGTLQWK